MRFKIIMHLFQVYYLRCISDYLIFISKIDSWMSVYCCGYIFE